MPTEQEARHYDSIRPELVTPDIPKKCRADHEHLWRCGAKVCPFCLKTLRPPKKVPHAK